MKQKTLLPRIVFRKEKTKENSFVTSVGALNPSASLEMIQVPCSSELGSG